LINEGAYQSRRHHLQSERDEEISHSQTEVRNLRNLRNLQHSHAK
jgi:hypothetical protein